MKHYAWIGLLFFLLALSACDTTTREARRMVKRAELLADTLPDSTVRLIDSVLRMPASFSERERMDMALLQAEALFGDRGQEISPVMDDDFFDEHANLSTGPELEYAANYFANKNQFDKAAHAALYSGFVQQHYEEKEAAMRSFKKAEQFGIIATDSLTMARAEYKMGKLLYYDGMEQEALVILKLAEKNMKNWHKDLALVKNLMAVCYMVQDDYGNAENCLQQSLSLAKKSYSEGVRQKALNNLAVLFRIQGEYKRALACLKQTVEGSDSNEQELLLYYLNMGKTFIAAADIDSAAHYLSQLEALLQKADVKAETKASAYSILCQFTENQGDVLLAEKYRAKREELLSKIIYQRQEQNIYRIQRQYDYESLQNKMNQEHAQIQRVIAIGTVFLLCLVALFLYRSSLRNKKEAEVNANLFHFMQQNKTLVESNMAQERRVFDTTQQLSDMYFAKFKTMQKLSFSIENPKNKIALKELEKQVFGDGEHWDGIKEVIDALYPGLWESITYKYPEMDEMERRVFILSRFKLPRMEEAALLGISTSVLDKLRTRVHKIVEKDKKQ